MSTTELIEMIEKLPADKQKEVEALVSELIGQVDKKISKEKKKPMKFGDLKGFVIHMSDGFDEPLEKKKKREFGGGKDIFGKMSDDFNEPLDELKDHM